MWGGCAGGTDVAWACNALVSSMVGVGVAEGGGGGVPDGYYGDYYPPEYYVPPEMCPHPQQHPQHAHMCTVHTEYGMYYLLR